jgi:hypothetical protein
MSNTNYEDLVELQQAWQAAYVKARTALATPDDHILELQTRLRLLQWCRPIEQPKVQCHYCGKLADHTFCVTCAEEARATGEMPKRQSNRNASAIHLIADERARQVSDEGWSPEHDDTHRRGELARAAACYAVQAEEQARGFPVLKGIMPKRWPWQYEWWKPSADPLRNLVKAGALIVAEIERLQRASAARESERTAPRC